MSESELPANVTETHSAVVVFVGDRAYKLKKAVDLGFLDFRRREAREAICHREVELNRRLAPDVYLGVADIHDPAGQPCDHLVVMRRMPPERRLSTLVQAGQNVDDELWDLAHLIAAFHASAARSPEADETASRDALAGRWASNTAGLEPYGGQVVDADLAAAVDRLAQRYLRGRRPLFDRRIREGRACDGHGDLLADDIFCLEDGPRVLDCIEFDDRLRFEDGLADVAFLAMDLERLGRPELARRFLAAYRQHANDTWPSTLAHHHVAYRAQVRAKVAAIRTGQGDETQAEEARRLLGLARSHLGAGAVRLVFVGGLPGTGKSTLAAGVADALDATVLRSDEVRKELAGLRPDEPAPAGFGQGLYRPEVTAETYTELLSRAETGLSLGESVVLDASWTDARWRAEARSMAEATYADMVEVRCTAPPAVAAERTRQRLATGGDPSDATPEIAAKLAATEDPWPTAHTVDTTGEPGSGVAEVLRLITGDEP